MNRFVKTFLILFIGLLMIQSAPAQPAPDRSDLKSQYERIQGKFEKARQLAGIIQNDRLQQLAHSIEKDLNDARRAYDNHNYGLAQTYLKAATVKLRQFYSIILKKNQMQQRLKDELDRRMNLAEQAVNRSNDQMARNLLNQAKYYRRRAYRLSDTPETALQNMLLAIFYAEKAASVGSGFSKTDRNQLERYFSDTRELLQQVNENEAVQKNATAAGLRNKANQEYRKAERLYQAGNTNQALQQLQMVNRLLYRIMDLSYESGDVLIQMTRNGLRDSKFRLQELSRSVQPGTQPVLHRRLQRAETLLDRAELLFRNQDYKGAQNHLTLVNRILAGLEGMAENSPTNNGERLARQIETARRIYNSLQAPASASTIGGKIYRLLGQSLARAEKAYQNGRYGLAIWQIRFFNHLSLRYDKLQQNRQAGQNTAREAEKRLNRLEQLLAQNESRATDDIGKFKTEAARELLKMAKEARSNGYHSQSAELANLGLKLLTQ